MTPQVVIHTDGSYRPNGKGGWAARLTCNGESLNISGEENNTTNNRMEILAVVKALEVLTTNCKVKIFTDSKYVKSGVESWARAWKRNGWKTRDGKPVKNRDLWERILELRQHHKIKMIWIKGHSGIPENEAVNDLAQLMSARP